MKIIIRNRNKNIEVSNITSKEEMVWIQPEQFEQITTDAGTMATEHYGATVYWKQSFVDFLEGPGKKDPQPVHGVTVREFLSQWPHSVGKDWSMFNNNIKV